MSVDDMFLNDFGFPDDDEKLEGDAVEPSSPAEADLDDVFKRPKPVPEEDEDPFEKFDYDSIGDALTLDERDTLKSIIGEETSTENPVQSEPEVKTVFENEFISDLPVVDVEREAELSVIREKKIKTPEESRFLAEAKAHDRAEALRLFRRLVEEAVAQLKTLPEIDARKVYEVCERATIPVKPMADFRDCAETLSQAQNMYSELSDCYEAAYVVYQNWKRHKEKLFKAFYTISSMPSDSTREGEAFLYMSKLADREAEYRLSWSGLR